MFYSVSKFAWQFAEPSNIMMLLTLAGLVGLGSGMRRAGRTLLAAAGAASVLIAMSPLGALVLAKLESRFPLYVDDSPIDGIVVLGGAIDPALYFSRPDSGMTPAIGRITHAATLAQKHLDARIIFAGGGNETGEAAHSEAAAALELFKRLGVDPSRVALDLDSRNTAENAIFAKKLASPKPGARWVMVTSAFHMPRAMGCFGAAGFPVIADPVDFRIVDAALGFHWWPDLAGGIDRTDLAAHEIAGLIAYRLSHRTDALFPAPEQSVSSPETPASPPKSAR